MKKFYTLFFSSLLFAAMFINNTGCKIDTPIIPDSLFVVGPPGKVANGKMSMKVDGVIKNADVTMGTLYTDFNTMQIVGTFGGLPATEALNLSITDIHAGEFDIDGNGRVVAIYLSSTTDQDQHYIGNTGKVNITTLTDKVVAGTFHFEGTNIKGSASPVITEGTFECAVIPLTQP